MKRFFLSVLVVLCLSQAAYAFEITKSEASEKAFVPYSRYAEKFAGDFLPTVSKYNDKQREAAEKTSNEALNWIKGDFTADSRIGDIDYTVYDGFSPVKIHLKQGFYKIFEFDGSPDYEWLDEKLIKAGATRYRGIAGESAIYSIKPDYNRIAFIKISGNSCTEFRIYCFILAFDGSSVTMSNEDLIKYDSGYNFALASNPKKSQFAKLKIKGSEDAVIGLNLYNCVGYENDELGFISSYDFAVKKSDEFILDYIPAVDGLLFFKFRLKRGSVESVSIEFETGEEIPEIKYGSEKGMLVLKGIPADLGAELVPYGYIRNDDNWKRPVIDDMGSYIFVAPAGYYKLRFGKNPYIDIDGEFYANNIPVSAGEATEVTIPAENLRTINELRKQFPRGGEGEARREGGSIDITDFTVKDTDGTIEMVINDKLERDVFPEAKDIKITENGVEGKVTKIERQPQPVDVVLVVDSSGSMKADMQPTIDAAKNFVKGLPDRTGIRFVQFAQKITTHKGETKADVIKALDTVKAIGATAMYDALENALKLLKGKKKPYIVLFSDGADSREPGVDGKGSNLTKEQIIRKLGDSKVTLLTIGFGKGHDPKTLKAMSEVTPNGMYVAAADKNALPSAFAAVSAKFGNQFKISYARPYTTLDTKSDVPVIGMMIDNSRSMDMDPNESPDSDCGYRMDKVKNIFHNFIAGLPDKSLMTLMTFTGGGMSTEEIHCKQVLTNDKGAVLKALSECAGISGTPTIDALAFAISNLKSVSSSKRVLVFFTDAGLDSEFADDESMLVRYEEQLAEIKKQNIRVLFAGLGGIDYIAKYKAPFEKAAKLSGGDFIITADSAEIGKKLDELIKKVDEPVVAKKNLTVSLVMDSKTEDGSRMNYSADRTYNDIEPLEKTGQVVKPGVLSINPGRKYAFKPKVKAPELVDVTEKADDTTIVHSIKFESKPKAHNRFAELEAQELYLLNRFKGFEPRNNIFAALKVKMAFKKADEKDSEIAYEIPSIFNHFYLSLNDSSLVAPSKLTWLSEKPLTTEPGKVNVSVDEKNSAEGFLVFDMPLKDSSDESYNQLSVCVFDESNGHIELPVIGRLSKKFEEVKKLPNSEPQKLTDAFSLKIKGLEDRREIQEHAFCDDDGSMFRIIDADFDSKVSALLDINPKERFYYALETDNGLLMSKMNNIVYSIPSGFYSKLKFAPGASTAVRMPFVIGKELASTSSYLWGDVASGDIKCKVTDGKPWAGKKLGQKFSHEYFDLIINDFGRYSSNKVAVDFTVVDKADSLGTGGVETLFAMNCKAAMPDNVEESGNHGTIIKTLTRRGLGNFGSAEFSVPGRISPDMEETRGLAYGINEEWGAFDGQSRRGIVIFSLTSNYEDSDEWELISDHIPTLKLKLTKDEFSNKALLVPDMYVRREDKEEANIDEAVDKAILRYAATHKNLDKTPKIGLNENDKPITTVAVPALTVYGTEKLNAVKSEQDILELFKNLKVYFHNYESTYYSPEAVITQGWGVERELVLIAESLFIRLGYTPVRRRVSLSQKGVEALMARSMNSSVKGNEPIALEIKKDGKPELFIPAFGKYLSELKGLCYFCNEDGSNIAKRTIDLTVSVYGKLIGEAGVGAQQAIAADLFGALGGSEDTTVEGGLKEHTTLFCRTLNVADLSTDMFDVAFSSVGKSKDGKGDLVCASVDTAAGLLVDKNLWIDTSCYELESVTISIGDEIKTTRLIASDTKLTNLHFTIGYNIPEMTDEAVKAYEAAVKARAEGIKDASGYANVKWQGHAAVARFAKAYNKACKDVAAKLGLTMARINNETPLAVAAIAESDGKNATLGIDLMNITSTSIGEDSNEKLKAYNTITGLLASQLEASALPGGKGQGFMHVWGTMPEDASIMFIDSDLREQASQYLAEKGFPKLLTDRMANTELDLSFVVPSCPGLRNGKQSWAWLEYDNRNGNLISVFDNGERSALAGYVLGLTPKNECNFMAGCLVGVACSNFAISAYSLETENYEAVWNASSKLCKALSDALCATESLLSAKDVQSYMTEAYGMIGGNVTKEHTGVDFYEVYKHMKIIKGDATYNPTFSEGFKAAVDLYFK